MLKSELLHFDSRLLALHLSTLHLPTWPQLNVVMPKELHDDIFVRHSWRLPHQSFLMHRFKYIPANELNPNHQQEYKMSDKLKIMQEPVVRQPMLGLDEGVNQDEGEQLFYKVETCSMHTYYIEVAAWQGSLLAAMDRLKSDFKVDASGYCKGCDTPVVQKIALVSSRDVPMADGKLVFVSRLQ